MVKKTRGAEWRIPSYTPQNRPVAPGKHDPGTCVDWLRVEELDVRVPLCARPVREDEVLIGPVRGELLAPALRTGEGTSRAGAEQCERRRALK